MKKDLSRRQFLHRTAGALAASSAIFLEPEHIPLPMQSTAPSDRLRFGIIGIGMQGSGLLRDAIQLPGVECVAACDLYDGRHTLANGIVGTLTLVEGSLGRNDPTGAWEYPPPPDLSLSNFDWGTWQGDATKRPWDPDTSPKYFARWRCWKEYGTGLAGDLLVHLVSGMNFMLGWNEPPKRAMALGDILRFKDGRNMPDVHATLFDYARAPIYLRLNLGCDTPEIYRFQGSKGILEVTEYAINYFPQSGEDESPSYYVSGYPGALREVYLKKWHEEHDPKPGKEPITEGFNYRGASWDEENPHLCRFVHAARNHQQVTEDAVFGHNAALACHMANQSYFRGAAVTWDATSNQIKS